jgi:hypothetical protein
MPSGDPHPPLLPRLPVPPEFKSKPLEPHPIFRDFIAASYQNRLAQLPANETAAAGEELRTLRNAPLY